MTSEGHQLLVLEGGTAITVADGGYIDLRDWYWKVERLSRWRTEVIELKNLDVMACECWKKVGESRRVKKAKKQSLPNGYRTEFKGRELISTEVAAVLQYLASPRLVGICKQDLERLPAQSWDCGYLRYGGFGGHEPPVTEQVLVGTSLLS